MGFLVPRMMFNLIVSVSSISIAMDLNETFFFFEESKLHTLFSGQTDRKELKFLSLHEMDGSSGCYH